MKKILPLLAAIVIAVTFGVAGAGKLLYPSPSLSNFNFCVAVIELLLSALLVVCYHRWEIWLLVGGIFALWGGYALFWDWQELPCGCLGEKVTLPPNGALTMDIVFFILCFAMAALLGAGWKKIVWGLVLAPLFVLGGYFFAKQVYQTLVIAGSISAGSSSGTCRVVWLASSS